MGGAALTALAKRHPPSTLAALARDAERTRRKLPEGVQMRLGDYDDRPSLDRALHGIRRVVFVASDGAARQVMEQHARFIEAVRD